MLRTAEIIDRCDACDAPATTGCRRCQRPACSDHAPGSGMLCRWCEDEFDRLTIGVIDGEPVDRGSYYARLRRRAFVRRRFWIIALGVAIGCLPVIGLVLHPRTWPLGIALLILFVSPLLLFKLGCAVVAGVGRLRRELFRRRFVQGLRREARR